MAAIGITTHGRTCEPACAEALVGDTRARSLAALAASPSTFGYAPSVGNAPAFDKYSDCSSSGSESTDADQGAGKSALTRKAWLSSASTCATDVPSCKEETVSCSQPLSSSDSCSDSDDSDMVYLALAERARLRANSTPFVPSVAYGTRRIEDLPEYSPAVSSTCSSSNKTRVETPASATPAKKRSSLPPVSSNSWTAHQRMSGARGDDVVERAARSILNKLTVEKFDALYEQLATCGVRTTEHIKILMREVFEKATMQHHFIPMYADLCVRLESDERLAPAMSAVGEPTSFRHLLLHQCQVAFEQLLEPRMEQPQDGMDFDTKEEQETLRKRRALGNVKFVGQLMVRGMLSSRLLVACSDALLRGQTTCPEALESLAALLTVAGKKFDGRPEWQYSDRLDSIFNRVRELTKDKTVPARVRFLLRDLLELREAGWPEQSRPAVAKEGPMRLDEVKERAAEESRDCHKATGAQASRQQRNSKGKESKEVVTARLDTLQRIVSNSGAEKIHSGSSAQAKNSKKSREPHDTATETKADAPSRNMRGSGLSDGKKSSGGANFGKGRNSAGATPSLLSMAQAAPAAVLPEQPGRQAWTGNSRSSGSGSSATESDTPSRKTSSNKRKSKDTTSESAVVSAQPAIQCVEQVVRKPEASSTVAVVPVPQEAAPSVVSVAPPQAVASAFSLVSFHREMSATLKELSSERNVATAVRRIRAQNVPKKHHASEFTDLLTRAAEETRGPARRSAFAFAAGLAAADQSCFDRSECINGARAFFADVYQELCSEVPRLPAIAASELVPTLRSVFPASALNEILPQELRAL